jgi:hypothetical protein
LPTEEYGDARFAILYGKNSQQGAVEGRKRHPLKKGRRWMLVKMPFQVLMLLVAFVRSLRSVSLSGFLTGGEIQEGRIVRQGELKAPLIIPSFRRDSRLT